MFPHGFSGRIGISANTAPITGRCIPLDASSNVQAPPPESHVWLVPSANVPTLQESGFRTPRQECNGPRSSYSDPQPDWRLAILRLGGPSSGAQQIQHQCARQPAGLFPVLREPSRLTNSGTEIFSARNRSMNALLRCSNVRSVTNVPPVTPERVARSLRSQGPATTPEQQLGSPETVRPARAPAAICPLSGIGQAKWHALIARLLPWISWIA